MHTKRIGKIDIPRNIPSQKSDPQPTVLVEVCAMPRSRRYSIWIRGTARASHGARTMKRIEEEVKRKDKISSKICDVIR